MLRPLLTPPSLVALVLCLCGATSPTLAYTPPRGRMMRALKTTFYTDFTGDRYGKERPVSYDIGKIEDRDAIRLDIARRTVTFLANFVEGFDLAAFQAELARRAPSSPRYRDPLSFLPGDVQRFVASIGGLNTTYVLSQDPATARSAIEPAKILFMIKTFLAFAADRAADSTERTGEDVARGQRLFEDFKNRGADNDSLEEIVDMVTFGANRRRFYHFTTPGPRSSMDAPGEGPVLADERSYIDNLQLMHDFYTQGANVAVCSACNWRGWPNTTRAGACPSCGAGTRTELSYEPPNHLTTRSYQQEQLEYMRVDESSGRAVLGDGVIFPTLENGLLAQRPLSREDLGGEDPYGTFTFETGLEMFGAKTEGRKLTDPSMPINEWCHRLSHARQAMIRVHYYETLPGMETPNRPGAVQEWTPTDIPDVLPGHIKKPEGVEIEYVDIPYSMQLFGNVTSNTPDAEVALIEQLRMFEKMVDAFDAPVQLPVTPHFPTLTPPGPPGVYTTRVHPGPVTP